MRSKEINELMIVHKGDSITGTFIYDCAVQYVSEVVAFFAKTCMVKIDVKGYIEESGLGECRT